MAEPSGSDGDGLKAPATLPALGPGCTLGFVGLGNQGRTLARHWLDRGHPLVLFDVRRGSMAELERDGAVIASSPAEVAARAALTAICVLDDHQTEQAVLAPDGILAGAAPGSILVVHSTISLACLGRLSKAAAAKAVTILDAPVSGGAGRAGTATSYMIGGPWEVVRHCLHLFGERGENITYAGPPGSGIKAKLAHQIVLCVNLLAASEGYRLAEAAGLDAGAMRDVLRFGVASSSAAEQYQAILAAPWAMDLFDKDLELAIDWARSLGVAVHGAELVRELLPDIFGAAGEP